VGLLVGLSVSPVVSGVLTTLGGLLGAMLGLQTNDAADASPGLGRFSINGIRIGVFGLACVAGVLTGLVIRVQDVLAVPLDQQVARWVDAGYSKKEARTFVAFQTTGLTLGGKDSAPSQVVSGDVQKQHMSVLFNALSDVNLCEQVRLDQYGDDPKQRAEQMLSAYHRLNLDDAKDKHTPLYKELGQLAGRLEQLPEPAQLEIMQSVEGILCAIQNIK